jgi:hypothetical protein
MPNIVGPWLCAKAAGEASAPTTATAKSFLFIKYSPRVSGQNVRQAAEAAQQTSRIEKSATILPRAPISEQDETGNFPGKTILCCIYTTITLLLNIS